MKTQNKYTLKSLRYVTSTAALLVAGGHREQGPRRLCLNGGWAMLSMESAFVTDRFQKQPAGELKNCPAKAFGYGLEFMKYSGLRGTRKLGLNVLFTLLFLLNLDLFSQHVVKIDVKLLLNTRSVTTRPANEFIIYDMGVDLSHGYMTRTAANANGNSNLPALPDDGFFPATSRHPDIELNYNNNDSTSKQTRYVQGAGEFTFLVPEKNYSQMMLFLTSALGSSSLTITMKYSDSLVTTKSYTLPDYYKDIPESDTNFFYLAHNLPKWNKSNKMQEAGHHNIDGLELHPDVTRKLTSITVKKAAAGYMVFWGANGVATGADEPTVPSNLSSSGITETSFTLSWNASIDSNGIVGYEVFNGVKSLGKTTNLYMDISGLTCNTSSSFTVKAFDSLGNWSALSVEISVKTLVCSPDTMAPSAPSNVTITNLTQTGFTISWSPSTDNVGITSYEVFRGTYLCGISNTTNLSVTGLSASTTYPITVKAKDAAGNVSSASEVLEVTTFPLAVQRNFTIVQTVNGIVNSDTPTGKVPDGSVIKLTTVAAAGFRFKEWTSGVPAADLTKPNPTITVTADTTVSAVFEAIPSLVVTLVANPTEGGSVDIDPASPILEGTEATILAKANTGFQFKNWTIGGQTFGSNPLARVISAAETITANFVSTALSVDPTSAVFPSSGGNGSVAVTTEVAWIAVKDAAWITITAGASGPEGGSVSYSVAANTGDARHGKITVTPADGAGKKEVAISQAKFTSSPLPSIFEAPCSIDFGSGFKWNSAFGYIYDGFYPFVYSFDQAAWIYVYHTTGLTETAGYFIYDFKKAQFGWTSCEYSIMLLVMLE